MDKGTKQRPLFFSSVQSLSLPIKPTSSPLSFVCLYELPFSYKKTESKAIHHQLQHHVKIIKNSNPSKEKWKKIRNYKNDKNGKKKKKKKKEKNTLCSVVLCLYCCWSGYFKMTWREF